MTDTVVPVTGGIAAATDNGVGAVATLAADGNSIQVLVYNHINSFDIATWQRCRSESTLVSLTVNDLPFTPTRVLHYVVDHTHSNSHTVWADMGKPAMPSAEQWDDAARRLRALLLRDRPRRRQLVDRDVSAKHLQRVSDRTTPVVLPTNLATLGCWAAAALVAVARGAGARSGRAGDRWRRARGCRGHRGRDARTRRRRRWHRARARGRPPPAAGAGDAARALHRAR